MKQTEVEIELTVRQLAAVDPAYWAWYNRIQLQHGQFSFADHEYQREPMSYTGRRKCCLKATQGGFTEGEVLISLHGMIVGRYPLGVLYMFPTTDDIGEFSKSRFGPMISANHRTIGQYVRNTDTAALKQVGHANLFLRGARLNQKIEEDSRESSKLRGISVDRCVFDEYDLMDPDAVAKARGRVGHSTVKEEIFLSNPTLPDFGIDLIFRQSDQRHWFRRCGCGAFTCAELSFPECVRLYPKGESVDGKLGYIACSKCGKPVPVRDGEWVPQARENTEYMQGYRWSQLTSVYNDPAEILSDFNDPPEGNLADVYRLRLGLPYAATEDRLQESQVFGCCNDFLPSPSHPGPAAMGVDVGKTKHVIIGLRTGRDQYEVLRATTLTEWSDIHDLARRYNVRSAVIDIRPYEDSARAFQKQASYPVYLCEYSESMTSGPQYNPNTGVVKVNRTEIMDRTHRLVATEGMLRVPRLCEETKLLAQQLCGVAKYKEKNKRTGVIVYRYKSVGSVGDHLRHALGYFLLAASGGKVAQYRSAGSGQQRRAINNFHVGARR